MKKPRKPRAPSAYNMYMKKAIAEYKMAHPNAGHQEAFRACAQNWKHAKGGGLGSTIGGIADSIFGFGLPMKKAPKKKVKGAGLGSSIGGFVDSLF